MHRSGRTWPRCASRPSDLTWRRCVWATWATRVGRGQYVRRRRAAALKRQRLWVRTAITQRAAAAAAATCSQTYVLRWLRSSWVYSTRLRSCTKAAAGTICSTSCYRLRGRGSALWRWQRRMTGSIYARRTTPTRVSSNPRATWTARWSTTLRVARTSRRCRGCSSTRGRSASCASTSTVRKSLSFSNGGVSTASRRASSTTPSSTTIRRRTNWQPCVFSASTTISRELRRSSMRVRTTPPPSISRGSLR
mmetsp:Transcript_19268/g.41601  ORF Transcript_19268/g.41601 Transcript_19268/m.41601 type:complete len:250 (-) Transcript_19268:1333-2082(-)